MDSMLLANQFSLLKEFFGWKKEEKPLSFFDCQSFECFKDTSYAYFSTTFRSEPPAPKVDYQELFINAVFLVLEIQLLIAVLGISLWRIAQSKFVRRFFFVRISKPKVLKPVKFDGKAKKPRKACFETSTFHIVDIKPIPECRPEIIILPKLDLSGLTEDEEDTVRGSVSEGVLNKASGLDGYLGNSQEQSPRFALDSSRLALISPRKVLDSEDAACLPVGEAVLNKVSGLDGYFGNSQEQSPRFTLDSARLALITPRLALGTPRYTFDSVKALDVSTLVLGSSCLDLTPRLALESPRMPLDVSREVSEAVPLGTPCLDLTPRDSIGSPRLVLGSPRFTLDSSRLALGSPRLVLGSPRLVLGSPRSALVSPRLVPELPSLNLDSFRLALTSTPRVASSSIASFVPVPNLFAPLAVNFEIPDLDNSGFPLDETLPSFDSVNLSLPSSDDEEEMSTIKETIQSASNTLVFGENSGVLPHDPSFSTEFLTASTLPCYMDDLPNDKIVEVATKELAEALSAVPPTFEYLTFRNSQIAKEFGSGDFESKNSVSKVFSTIPEQMNAPIYLLSRLAARVYCASFSPRPACSLADLVACKRDDTTLPNEIKMLNCKKKNSATGTELVKCLQGKMSTVSVMLTTHNSKDANLAKLDAEMEKQKAKVRYYSEIRQRTLVFKLKNYPNGIIKIGSFDIFFQVQQPNFVPIFKDAKSAKNSDVLTLRDISDYEAQDRLEEDMMEGEESMIEDLIKAFLNDFDYKPKEQTTRFYRGFTHFE